MTTPTAASLSGNVSTMASLWLSLEEIPPSLAVAGAIIKASVIILGVFGNFLIIAAVLVKKNLRKRNNTLVVSMSLADILMLLIEGSWMTHIYIQQRWTGGGYQCFSLGLLAMMRSCFGAEHVVAITCFRYVAVVHSHLYHHIDNVPFLVCLLIFIYLFPPMAYVGSAGLGSLTQGEASVTEAYFYNTKKMACGKRESELTANRFFMLIPIVYILFNGLILVYCYLRIYLFVRKSRKNMETWVSSRSTEDNKKKLAVEMMLLKTMALIFVTFAFSYLPLTLLAISEGSDPYSHAVFFPTLVINWMLPTLNWVMYGANNPSFRAGYMRVLRCGRASGGQVDVTQSHTGHIDKATNGTKF